MKFEGELRFSWLRTLCIVLLATVLAGLLISQAVKPVRKQLALRFTARGDSYLVAQDFDSAIAEYHKALNYDTQLVAANEHLHLAEVAATDIAKAANFYQEHNVITVLQKLAAAQKPYATAKQALQEGASLYADQEYSYAQYPLQLAVHLDPQYPEAWHYLGLTYQQLAHIDPAYLVKAQDAFAHRDSLTVMYLGK